MENEIFAGEVNDVNDPVNGVAIVVCEFTFADNRKTDKKQIPERILLNPDFLIAE